MFLCSINPERWSHYTWNYRVPWLVEHKQNYKSQKPLFLSLVCFKKKKNGFGKESLEFVSCEIPSREQRAESRVGERWSRSTRAAVVFTALGPCMGLQRLSVWESEGVPRLASPTQPWQNRCSGRRSPDCGGKRKQGGKQTPKTEVREEYGLCASRGNLVRAMECNWDAWRF